MKSALSTHVSSQDVTTALTAILDGRPRPLAGITPRGIPKVLAAMLEHWDGADGYPATATGLLEYVSGGKITLRVIRPAPGEPPGERSLTGNDPWQQEMRYRLDADGIASCRWRHAVLVAEGGAVAASVALTWLPARLPWDTCADLDAGQEPAGRVLGRLPGGVRRLDRRAGAAWTLDETTGQPSAVTSSAVLAVGGHGRVAVAEERILAGFAESLAGENRVFTVRQQHEKVTLCTRTVTASAAGRRCPATQHASASPGTSGS